MWPNVRYCPEIFCTYWGNAFKTLDRRAEPDSESSLGPSERGNYHLQNSAVREQGPVDNTISRNALLPSIDLSWNADSRSSCPGIHWAWTDSLQPQFPIISLVIHLISTHCVVEETIARKQQTAIVQELTLTPRFSSIEVSLLICRQYLPRNLGVELRSELSV